MAQVKVLFPSLTNAGGLFSVLAPHTALLSLALPEDQNNQTTQKESFRIKVPKPQKWSRYTLPMTRPIMFDNEKIKSLCFAMEEDNDYEEGAKGSDFVHVLQLQDECDLNELETVKSEGTNEGGKWSEMSETESVEESVVISL